MIRRFAVLTLCLGCMLAVSITAARAVVSDEAAKRESSACDDKTPKAEDAAKSDTEQEEKLTIKSPLSDSVLLSNSIDVICKFAGEEEPALVIDGEPAEWDPIVGSTRAVRVRLEPGVHELKVGDQEVRCVVAINELDHDGPSDWPIQRSHYISRKEDRCARCHETEQQNELINVGQFKGPETCIECHDLTDFEANHMHVYQPLEACHSCHAIHGSTEEEALLKAPIRQLCEGCHDPDH